MHSAPSPWHGAPGPWERKPAGQAQWKEPAVLSQRPGPQGGGSWAHSSTSSSHAEPRKPAGQTQRKEPDRFSQTPLPQRPGLCVHSSTSARGKGPRVTPLCPPPRAPLCLPDLHQSASLSVSFCPPFPIIQILHPTSLYLFNPQASCPPPRTLVSISRLLSVLFSITLPPSPRTDISLHPPASPSSMTQLFCFSITWPLCPRVTVSLQPSGYVSGSQNLPPPPAPVSQQSASPCLLLSFSIPHHCHSTLPRTSPSPLSLSVPHPGSRLRGEQPGTQRGTRTRSCLECSRSARGHTAAARGGTRPRL